MEGVSRGTIARGRAAAPGSLGPVPRHRALDGLRRLAAALLLAAASGAHAHESEQYTLPAGRDFADLGPQLSRAFLAAIRDAVADTNAAIDAALDSGALPAQVQSLQSAGHIADQVWGRIFNTYPTNELLDLGLVSPSMRERYPGLVTMYRPVASIYDDPWLMLDVSKPVRAFFRAGTVSAGGVLFGTDKIIHFINVGRIYHVRYLAAVERGLDEAEAALDAVQATARNPLLSEDGLLGLYTTGIRSNGDLAADYAGLKFYRNLTESVQLGAARQAPMLQREGPHWRVAVLDEDRVFSAFVSPHWNEVLNPNRYVGYVGRRVRSVIATRCEDVSDWYRGGRGQPLDRAWFDARQHELATFHGEPYGHELDADPVSVARICWPGAAAPTTEPDDPLRWGAALPPQADTLGRGAPWWAAAAGDNAWLERLAAGDAVLDQPDRDGETPLHAAVRHGHLHSVQWLLARGADANRAAAHGVTPLLLATGAGRGDVAEALLRAGADPDAQDGFGRSALHEAAQRGDMALAGLLLRHGADALLASRHGSDALLIAQRAGHDGLRAALRASAPVVRKLGPVEDSERGAAGQVAVSSPHSGPDAAAQRRPAR